MLNKRALLASSAVAVLSSVGAAQADGFYVSVYGGANFQADRSSDGTFNIFPGGGTVTVDPEAGFLLGAAVGVRLDQWLEHLRAEIEASYRRNQLDGHWTAGSVFMISDSGPVDGHLSTFAVLANIWYDIDVGSRVVPYIGGGVGWGRSRFDGALIDVGTFAVENNGFVFQLGVGLNYEVQDGVHLGGGYRYFRGPDVKSNVFVGKSGNVNLPVAGERDNHTVLISLTIDTN